MKQQKLEADLLKSPDMVRPGKYRHLEVNSDNSALRPYEKRTCSTRANYFLTGTTSARASSSTSFPGQTSESKSPNGLYAIQNFDSASKGEMEHHLYLSKKGDKKLFLHSYTRQADILWSPDSSAFVLNDWVGSNITESFLYRINDMSHPIEINAKLTASVKNVPDKNSLENCDHLYIFATSWITASALNLKMTGHGPNDAFTIFYVWDLKQSFKRVRRVSRETAGREDG